MAIARRRRRAGCSTAATGLAVDFDGHNRTWSLEIVFYFALVNLLLGLFNLLPIPPLDGSALIERFIPNGMAAHAGTGSALRAARALRARVLVPGVISTILIPSTPRCSTSW